MNEVWLVILPLIAGYLLDLAFGDPRTIPHPVVGFGNMISWAERHFNCGRFRKWKGAVVALSFPLFVGMIGWGITVGTCLFYPSPGPRDSWPSRMPPSA